MFAERMLALLRDFRPDAGAYQRFRDVQQRELQGWKTQQPYYHASYYANQALRRCNSPSQRCRLLSTRRK